MQAVSKDAHAVLCQAFTPGLIKMLAIGQQPRRFLATLFGHDTVRKPWVIWGPDMLQQLRDCIKEVVLPSHDAACLRTAVH